MKSKKYIKSKIKTRKNKLRKNKSRKNKKGGFFKFLSRNKKNPNECDVNKLSMIKEPNDMKQNYLKCCPKTFFGKKNSSPYCKQLDLTYNNILNERNANSQFSGSSPEEIFEMRRQNKSFIDPLNNTAYDSDSDIKKPSYYKEN